MGTLVLKIVALNGDEIMMVHINENCTVGELKATIAARNPKYPKDLQQLVLADVVLSTASETVKATLETGCTNATLQLVLMDEMKLHVSMVWGRHHDNSGWF